MIKKNEMSKLLNDNVETYYWIGFLLADGYFGDNHIKCTLSSQDKEHLLLLAKFLNIDQVRKSGKYVEIKGMDKDIIPIVKKKFDIKNKKTYSPPTVLKTIENKNLLISLLCGFIDGDGCIANKRLGFSLTVKCHSSWLTILDFFGKKINSTTQAKINNDGYAYFTITNYKSLINLKNTAIELNLPILKRKWDKIKLDYIPHKEALDRKFINFEKAYHKFNEIPYYKNKLNELFQR